MRPFIIEHKSTGKKYLVVEKYEKRFTPLFLLVDMEAHVFSVIQEINLRMNYKFVRFYEAGT